MARYFLGIDNGGTLCKAVLFDEGGNEVAQASRKLRMITPQAGFTERDMEELWAENVASIRELIEKSKVDPRTIEGVGCTGHGKGLYLWGKDDKPCYKGIVSTDSRAWQYPEKWEADGTAERVFQKTFQKILACQPVSILAWFKDNHPEILPKVRWIFEAKDYIRFRLTGEAYAEFTDYSGSNLLNLRKREFDRDLLAEFGLQDLYDALPPLKKSSDACGKISAAVATATGLREGTPVAGGMFDIDACAIAMGLVDEQDIAVIAGTWSINEYISKKPVVNKSIMMNSLYAMEEYYLIEESSPTSAGNHAWFVDLFMAAEKVEAEKRGISVYQYADELAASVAPEDQNIIFLPYLYGSNYDPRAKAGFVGLDSHHSKADMIRAVMEGIAFCHFVHLETFMANRSRTRAIRLSGGAAKSRLWAQIFADVFQLPVETVETQELGALGAAMTAAVASGLYPDLPSAIRGMTQQGNRFEPQNSVKASYRKKYDLYKKVSDALSGLWKEF